MLSPQQIPALNVRVRLSGGRILPFIVSVVMLLLLASCQSTPRGQAAFQRVELAGRVPADGQLLLADVGGDAATDVLLLSRQPGRLAWFENPGWQPHQIPLVADVLHGVAAYNPPGSSAPGGLAVNGRFSQPGAGTRQQLIWLQSLGRDVAQQDWTSSLIRDDVLPGSLVWADMTGTGRQILVALPGLEAYTLPRRLSLPWGFMPLTQEPVLPNRLRVYDWDVDGRDDLLVVNSKGLDIMALASRGLFVDEFSLISADDRSASPAAGFADVGVGQLGRPGLRFVATLSVDARQLMVFRPNSDERLPWVSETLDDALDAALVLKVADLNRDNVDEILVGHANGVTVYYYAAEQPHWQHYSIESGIAIADIQILPLTGGGFPDIVTAPAETGPLLLFQNRLRD
ncbi:MAG: hypothetical protein KKD00_12490 [Gammaproteobacteria bacterium]|nr:hypothetical protein [Gammaproteobacteria bacterium]